MYLWRSSAVARRRHSVQRSIHYSSVLLSSTRSIADGADADTYHGASACVALGASRRTSVSRRHASSNETGRIPSLRQFHTGHIRRQFSQATGPDAKLPAESESRTQSPQQAFDVSSIIPGREASETVPPTVEDAARKQWTMGLRRSDSRNEPRTKENGGLVQKKSTTRKSVQEVTEEARRAVYPGTISAQVIGPILRTVRSVRQLGLPDRTDGHVAESKPPPRPLRLRLSTIQLEKVSMRLARSFSNKRSDPIYRDRLLARMKLPVMSQGRYNAIFEQSEKLDVLIIPGSTGSGKTTQVPQIILDYQIRRGRAGFTNIICTQPRRMSATSVARRVAYERNEMLGETVGFHVRHSNDFPRRHGHILYCTNGILWTYLQTDPDYILDTSSHIIVDEVHERTVEIDLILLTLKKLIYQRREAGKHFPKVLLMSATINAEAFANYFKQSPAQQDPLRTGILPIPGHIHPIEDYYLEDLSPILLARGQIGILELDDDTAAYLNEETQQNAKWQARSAAANEENQQETTASDQETIVPLEEDDLSDDATQSPQQSPGNSDSLVPTSLTALAILHVLQKKEGGDILVFLPGMAEIDDVGDLLEGVDGSGSQETLTGMKVKLFKLHADLSETNDEVFEPLPPGWRRVMLATNIAETSVTLPDVRHVIDTGTRKSVHVNYETASRGLATIWIDQQSQQQRRGRAGRVSAGNFYALYTRARCQAFEREREPEMMTDDLTDKALAIKSGAHPMDFASAFALAPNPPRIEQVERARSNLKHLGAITHEEKLTTTGRVLSRMSIRPAFAKAVLLGILFRCLEPMLLVAAIDEKVLVVAGHTSAARPTEQRWKFSEGTENQLIANINAYKAYKKALESNDPGRVSRLFTEMNVRSSECLKVTRDAESIYEELHRMGFLPALEASGASGFPAIPQELNVNSHNIPLIKALLANTIQSEVAVRFSAHSWLSRKGLMTPAPGFVNHRVKDTKLMQGLGGRIPARGDILCYTSSRTVTSNQRQLMDDSGMASPLMTTLMANGVSVRPEEGTINIDNVVNMHIDFADDRTGTTSQQKLSLIYEFRKMLERFEDIATSSLEHRESPEDTGTTGLSQFDDMFRGDSELRDVLIKGLVEVFSIDAQNEAHMLQMRREEWELARADKKADKDLATQMSMRDWEFDQDDVSNNDGRDEFPTQYRFTPSEEDLSPQHASGTGS